MATRVDREPQVDLHVRLDRILHADLVTLAQREERSLNQMLNKVVERGLAEITRRHAARAQR